VFKASLLRPNIRLSGRRAAAYLSLSSSTRSRTPRSQPLLRRTASYFPLSHSSPRNARALRREIQTQNSRSHIAMSYQFSFAWKASLTRTPPPICTSALGSHTALVRRASSVANELQIHHGWFL